MVSGIGGTSGGSCVRAERGGGGGRARVFIGVVVVVFISKSVVDVYGTSIVYGGVGLGSRSKDTP